MGRHSDPEDTPERRRLRPLVDHYLVTLAGWLIVLIIATLLSPYWAVIVFIVGVLLLLL